MGDLTKNLSRSEFACECGCGFDTVDVELVEVLQKCVHHFEGVDGISARIKITGPNRCVEHNEKVQKHYNPDYVPYSSKTQHIYGRAADFKLFNRFTNEQIDPDRVADYLEQEYSGRFGMGRYSNRVHFDTRTIGPARWDKR
jgi:uncharacterized protein YcbK (DUF882 family)